MHIVDRILGWFLVLLGCIHNFVAAPLTYHEVSQQALWFVSAGLALWYAGFINILRAYTSAPGRLLLVFCAVTNITLLAFVLTYAITRGNWTAPASVALIGSAAALTWFSLAGGAAAHAGSFDA